MRPHLVRQALIEKPWNSKSPSPLAPATHGAPCPGRVVAPIASYLAPGFGRPGAKSLATGAAELELAAPEPELAPDAGPLAGKRRPIGHSGLPWDCQSSQAAVQTKRAEPMKPYFPQLLEMWLLDRGAICTCHLALKVSLYARKPGGKNVLSSPSVVSSVKPV